MLILPNELAKQRALKRGIATERCWKKYKSLLGLSGTIRIAIIIIIMICIRPWYFIPKGIMLVKIIIIII